MPSFARALGDKVVISSPWNSIVPALGGKSPEMTLNSVVLPAPFGPRMARLSPCATSRSTSRTAWRPPNRRPIPRRRRIGSACSGAAASVTRALGGDLRGLRMANPRQAPLHARRGGAAGRGRLAREGAAERLGDTGDVANRLDRQLAALGIELLVVDGDDRLTVRVEVDRPVRRGELYLRERLLQVALRAHDVALDRLEAGNETPRVHVVTERERARRLRCSCAERRDRLEPLADDAVAVVLGSRGCEVASRAGTADVGADDAGRELLELPRGSPEQVADELLPVDRAMSLLIGLQE